MPPKAKTTTYAARARAKPSSKKETEPEDQADSDPTASTSIEGKLLEEIDSPAPKQAQSRAKAAPAPKSILKKSIQTGGVGTKKALRETLPSSTTSKDKKVDPSATITTTDTTTNTKSKVPAPALKSKSKTRRANLSDSESDEEERVVPKSAPSKVSTEVKAVPAKSKPMTVEKKSNSSKISSSGSGGSRPSSLESKTSSIARQAAITAACKPSPKTSPKRSATTPIPTNDNEELEIDGISDLTPPTQNPQVDESEDEFGPDPNSDMIDAIDQDLAAKGLSSSPAPITKASSVTTTKFKKTVVGFPSSPKMIVAEPDVEEAVDQEEHRTSSQLSSSPDPAEKDNGDQEEEEEAEPEQESQLPVRGRNRDLKRRAEYDSTTLVDSEEGTAGLLLEEMSSAAKKPRLSVQTPKTPKQSKKKEKEELQEEQENDTEGEDVEVVDKLPKKPRAPPKPKTTPKAKKSDPKTSSPAPPLPELDYEALASAYDKETIRKLLLAKLDAAKTCDWYELSLQLAKDGVRKRTHGKKGKKMAEMISGNDLCDLYRLVVLPSIKAGKALWESDRGSSPGSTVVQTPEGDDMDVDEGEEYESEEEEEEVYKPARSTKSGRVAPRRK